MTDRIAIAIKALEEAGRLLRIAYYAKCKMGLTDRGGDCGLSHEVRMFAQHFSALDKNEDGKHEEFWKGDGAYDICAKLIMDAYTALRQPSPTMMPDAKETWRKRGADIADAIPQGRDVQKNEPPPPNAHAHTKEQLAKFAEQHVAPTMMPDAVYGRLSEAASRAALFLEQHPSAESLNDAKALWDIAKLLSGSALSCDAFRNWLGGVGGRK